MKLYTSAAIGRVLGLSEKEIKALTKAGVIKKGYTERRLYRLEDTAKEIIANYKKPEDQRENVDYTAERAKFMRIKRQNEEYNLQIRKGQLVQTDEAELVLSKILVAFKSRLSAIPSRVAPRAAVMTNSADIFDMVKERIDEALVELSDFDNVFGSSQNDE